MSEQTARLVARLRARLQRTIRRMTWAELAFGGAVFFGSLATIWLLAVGLEASFWLGTNLRTTLTAFAGAVALGIAGAFVARPLARLIGLIPGPSEEEVARTVGEHHPVVADRLVNLLQLAEGRRTHAPAPLVDQAVRHLADRIEEVSFDDVEDFSRARRAARFATVPLIAVLAFLVAAPSTFLDASERLLAPRTEFERPAPFRLSVSPGDTRLVKGDSLQVAVHATGEVPQEATLLLRTGADTEPERIALQADSVGTFRHAVPNVRDSLRYRVAAAPVRTRWYTVDVVNRPLLQELQLVVTPPAYTGRPARQLDPNVGDVTALPGARVQVTAALEAPPVDDATIAFEDGTEHALDVRGDSAGGSFSLQREGSYVIRLESPQGVTNRNPIRYQTSLQSDAQPSASFLEPEGSAELSPDLTQQLRVQLSDDYGFRAAKLYYRRTGSSSSNTDSSFSSIDLPLDQPGNEDQVLSHQWLLAQESGLDLEPGERVEYYVEVWDNDVVSGPKSGRTRTQHLHLPSRAEQYEELDDAQQETREQMEELQRESNTFRQQFQELRDELRRTRDANWENQRQLEQLQQQQQQMDESVEDLSRQVEEQNREMQRKDLSSSETAKKFEELKRTIDEIKSPELQNALEQLEKSMQNKDFRQMQQALENVDTNQEQYKQRLERALDLFKQLKAQQKLEEMARRTQELSEKEKSLAEKTQERMESSAPADSTEGTRSNESSSETSPSPSDSTSGREATSDSTARPSPSEEPTAGDSTATGEQRPDSDTSSTNAPPPSDDATNEDLASEQKQVAEQMKELMETMQEAQKDMEDVSSAPQKQMQQLNEQLQEQNLPEQMEQTSQQLQQNELSEAHQRQQQMQQSLQQAQEQLSQMQQGMQGQQRSVNMAGLRTALENTLHLSRKQEQLQNTVQDLTAEGPTVRRYARDQKALSDGLETVADSLQSIARRLPEMSRTVQEKTGNALRSMGEATTALDEREANRATGHQKTSMMHLNDLALLLSDLLDQMQQSQGSGGSMSAQQMMQQLQQMSGGQQKLNQQIQNFLNEMQGERLSQDMEERRKQLAEQQRQIKEQLEEMNADSDTQEQILGDLQKIAEQMEQSAEDLEGGQRERDLLNRQQQILTRLLNAQQSLRTQGREQQRRGEQADDYDPRDPGERPDQDEADKLRRDLIRALEMGYSSDYEALIKRYFELLQEQE